VKKGTKSHGTSWGGFERTGKRKKEGWSKKVRSWNTPTFWCPKCPRNADRHKGRIKRHTRITEKPVWESRRGIESRRIHEQWVAKKIETWNVPGGRPSLKTHDDLPGREKKKETVAWGQEKV